MWEWVSGRWFELPGVFFSLLYLFFSIRRNILLWPMGIISALLYMVFFFQSKFYADMALNGYYLVISVYGWLLWRGGGTGKNDNLKISRLGWRTGLVLLAVTSVVFLVIGSVLVRFTDSPIPWWDAFTTALSFTATWMLARKILEHWIIWIAVDSISMGLYFYRGLYPTMVLFAIYTVMAVTGFISWKKAYLYN
ncbi:MAG: nicotinamide riboside transporter PnuC [Bacteroidetes bacterium]|nr:MAG: nicotinamide riboside transporter PnuC [Bacteroidota bacterium]